MKSYSALCGYLRYWFCNLSYDVPTLTAAVVILPPLLEGVTPNLTSVKSLSKVARKIVLSQSVSAVCVTAVELIRKNSLHSDPSYQKGAPAICLISPVVPGVPRIVGLLVENFNASVVRLAL